MVNPSLACIGSLLAAPAALAAAQGCPVAAPPLSLPAQSTQSTLTADRASLVNDIATANGSARLTRDGQVLSAPHMRFNRKNSQAEASGGLQYRRDGLYLQAANGSVNTQSKTGRFNNTRYSVTTNGARGKAATVSSLGDRNYRLIDANYTTCDGPTKAWLLSAKRIDLDRNTGRGVARDATLRIYGLPVLYTPYINFPIDNRRHTGFLAPVFGVSSKSGFELAAPYYFNIAPGLDATLVPRILTQRGFQLGAQARYLTEHQRGEFDGQYLPADAKYGSDRSFVHFRHEGQLNPYVGVQADYNRVSDDNYFDDLDNDLAHTSTSQLERAFQLTAAEPGVRFTLLAQDFQTLNDNRFNNSGGGFNNSGGPTFSTDPYTRVPQARLEMLSPTAPFQAGVDAEFTNFRRDDSIDAYREDMRPRVLWGVDHGGWWAGSEAAYRVTRYDLRNFSRARANNSIGSFGINPKNNVINRTIPSFKIDGGLRFSRTLGNNWIQTLEPRAQYLYVGYENQSNIPVFDSGTADLHYDRLFADNRFTGIDRIGDANQITLGVTSRFISPNSGRTVAQLDLGRVTGFRDLKVGLPGGGESGYAGKGSDYLAGVTLQPTDAIRGEALLQYDPHNHRVNRAMATTTLGRRAGYQLDLGYRYYRDYRPFRDIVRYQENGHNRYNTQIIPGRFETLEQTVLGVRAPVTSGIDLIGRWNYSIQRSQNVETLAGVEYRPSCCYATRLAWRRYVTYDGQQDTAIMFQFVLQGLGQFGNSIQDFVDGNVFSNQLSGRSDNTFDTIGAP